MEYVPKLLFPLANGFAFPEGYFARVEDGRLYGRLVRLFVRPLLRALGDETDDALGATYPEAARTAIEQYAAEAPFNGLDDDCANERDQVGGYAAAVTAPGGDHCLPACPDDVRIMIRPGNVVG